MALRNGSDNGNHALKPSIAVWMAYSGAYQARYGVAPIRNATVNSQIAQFVKRVPADEAPRIAGHYVRNNAARYVAPKHPIRLLLVDAEKLRTEWATGQVGTETEARQVDQRQTRANVWEPLVREAEDAKAADAKP